MVFLNYSTMEMVAKIVYYGPGLGGKTTNLKSIYEKTQPHSRGEMVSLATETDRTLFFDLLPMDVGVIGGFKTKFQLYTVPGQVFYNTTRKLVLRGVDGIVFVADSQVPMMDANMESFQNMKDNLAELNLGLSDVPLVLQYNKRDLPNIMDVATMNENLNKEGFPAVEASALTGVGVFETLREISRQTLMELNNRNLGKKKTEPKPKADAPPEIDSEAMPEDVSFDDIEETPIAPEPPPQPVATPKEARDSFEKTLDKMELDLSDEDDFLDDDSLDMEEFDEWEEEDSLEGSLEDSTDDTSPGQIVTRELPDPITEPDAIPTYDLDEAEMVQDLVDGPVSLPDELPGQDAYEPNMPELDLVEPTAFDGAEELALDSSENEMYAVDEAALEREVDAALDGGLNALDNIHNLSVADEPATDEPDLEMIEEEAAQHLPEEFLDPPTEPMTIPSLDSTELPDLDLDDDMDLEESFSGELADDDDDIVSLDDAESSDEEVHQLDFSMDSPAEMSPEYESEFSLDNQPDILPEPEPDSGFVADEEDASAIDDFSWSPSQDASELEEVTEVQEIPESDDSSWDQVEETSASEPEPAMPASTWPAPEVITDPESNTFEPEDIAEPEVVAEPEPEVIAEPEPEVIAEPEPEVIAEPEVAAEPDAASQPAALAPEPTIVSEPVPDPIVPAPAAKAKPKRKASNSLDELKRLTTRIQTSKLGKKKDAGVDDLLTGMLGGKEKKAKADKFAIQVPSSFQDAQLNCVFLDDDGNVIKAELLKLKPRKTGSGKYQMRLTIDVEVDE